MSEQIKFWEQVKGKIWQIICIATITSLFYFVAGFFVEEQGRRTILTVIVATSYLVCRKQQTGRVVKTGASVSHQSEFYVLGVLFGFFVICYIALAIASLLK